MPRLMLDTSAAQQARYYELLRRMSPGERGRSALSMSALVRQLASAGILMRHPGISDAELRVRMAVRLYGRKIAKRLFGTVPADAR